MVKELPNLTFEQTKEAIMKAEKERRKHNEDLEARAKKLYELVVTESFTVIRAKGRNYPTSFTPRTETVIDGPSPVYTGGYISKTFLEVEAENLDIPTKFLIFDGYLPAKSGDYIVAKIPRYKEETISPDFPLGLDAQRILCIDREFIEEEKAIEIVTFNGPNPREDTAADYEFFMKQVANAPITKIQSLSTL